jgi:hypothetical protein
VKENGLVNTHKYIKQVYDCLLQEEKDVSRPCVAGKINLWGSIETFLICEKQLQFRTEPFKI